MPRFILHRSKGAPRLRPEDSESPEVEVPEDLRTDPRVTIIDEMPRLLLIECPEEAADEWQARMPDWKLQQEHRAKIPDPRPKLREPSD